MLTPKIVENDEIKLVGIKINTSLSESNTVQLWKNFMPQVKNIQNRINELFYSVQVYPDDMTIENFTPITEFEKWAAVQVSNFDNIPDEMRQLIISAGTYAVFKHRGVASDFFRTSQEIYGTWFPASNFDLDSRPHFEIMNADYKGPDDPDSEEDVFIPVKPK